MADQTELIYALEKRLAARQQQVEIYKAALEQIAKGPRSRSARIAREALKLGAGR